MSTTTDTCIAQILAVFLLNLLEVRVDCARDVNKAIGLNLEVAISQLLQRLCGKLIIIHSVVKYVIYQILQ